MQSLRHTKGNGMTGKTRKPDTIQQQPSKEEEDNKVEHVEVEAEADRGDEDDNMDNDRLQRTLTEWRYKFKRRKVTYPTGT